MPSVGRGERQIHYSDLGTGPAVMLLPGIGGGSRVFGTLPRRFDRHGHRCLTYDPIGVAPSSPQIGAFDFDAAAADVLAVLDHAGVTRVHLVCTSLGGKVALCLDALRRRVQQPTPIERLVLLAASAVVTTRARRIYEFFETAADQLDGVGLARVIAPFLFGQSFHRQHPAAVTGMLRAARPSGGARQLMAAQARALQSYCGRAAAAALTCPVLCVGGLEDHLTLPEEVRETAALIPGAELLWIPDAGHSLLLESPSTFEAVLDFIGRPT